MIDVISNQYIEVGISRQGVEITHIISKATGLDYMWNANPDIWGSSAPVLFPAIGSFKNNQCVIEGITYNIPKHGFIRHNTDIELKHKTDSKLVYELTYSPKTMVIYPYKFKFCITFSLEENRLIVSHTVDNLDDKTIYFSLGAHPAFKCPLYSNESYDDYYLEFEKKEFAYTTLLGENGLISDNKKLILNNTNKLGLRADLFDDDALIFKTLKSKKIALKSKMSSQVLTVCFDDFDYLGIWAKPNAPFVCIEPWLGIADHENTNGDFLEKEGLISLEETNRFQANYIISIDD